VLFAIIALIAWRLLGFPTSKTTRMSLLSDLNHMTPRMKQRTACSLV
jgi:hypothetical protein